MGTAYKEANAKCPFYNYIGIRQIKCEGAVERTMNTTSFSSDVDKAEWFTTLCCKDFKSCPVYRMIMKEKYDKQPINH